MATQVTAEGGSSTDKMEDDFDARSKAFQAWFLSQPGASLNENVAIADYREKNAGRGMKALKDISEDTELFSIPRSSILSVDNSSLVQNLPTLFFPPTKVSRSASDSEGDEEDNVDGKITRNDNTNNGAEPAVDPNSWTALILVLVYEFFRQDQVSPWKPYLNVLPEHFDTLMFWTEQQLAELKGCSVIGRIGKQSAEVEFRDTIIPILRRYSSVFFGQHSKDHDWSDEDLMVLAHRMGSTIMVYAFDVYEGDDKEEVADEDGFIVDNDDDLQNSMRRGMVPMADLLNADAQPNARLFQGLHSLSMRTLRPIAAGEEILNDYGQLPRSELLRRYGYVTPNYAPFDCVEISLDAVVEAANMCRDGSLERNDISARLAYLEEKEIVEDGAFEIVWPDQGLQRSYFQLDLIRTVCCLLAGPDDYKTAAKSSGLDSLLRKGVKNVLRQLLNTRLAEYAGNIHEDGGSARSSDPDVRHRMAIEVRAGEKKLLREAIESLVVDMDEPQSKRRKKESTK